MALEFSWLHMLRPLEHRLLDGLMTGNMDHYTSQPVVADRFMKIVGDYARH